MKGLRILVIGLVLLGIFVMVGTGLAHDVDINGSSVVNKADNPINHDWLLILSTSPEQIDTSILPFGNRCFFRWAEHCVEADASWPEVINR